MKLYLAAVLLLLFSSNAKIYAADSDENAPRSQQAQQEVWGQRGQLIKNAMVSSLVVAANNPKLMSDQKFTDHLFAVGDLVLLFDSMVSDNSTETLASLSSYNLGESTHETYTCLVERKGKRIQAALTRMLSSKKNECIEKYGSPEPHPSGAGISVCLPDDIYRNNLKMFLDSISKNKKCTFEQ